MKKLQIIFLGVLILPSLTFAAFDDVTLTTDTVISVGGYTLNVSGSGAVVSSIVIDTSSFSVALSSGSSIQITSPTFQQLSVDVGTFTTSNTCITNSSVLTLSSSGASGTVVVTPTATICSTPVSSGGGGGGGGWSASSPTAPVGGFTATAGQTNSQNKTILHFGFGNDITSIAISDNANFTPVSYINATSSIEWTVTSTKILYVKYCNQYSKCSNPISVQINAFTSTVAPSVSNSYKFYRNLAYKMNGPDVLELQKYLNINGFVIAQSGAGSPGNETSYFGPATLAVLIRFQQARSIEPAVGYFGTLTRAIVNVSAESTLTPDVQTTPSTPASFSFTFTQNLSIHDSGPEVKKLQEFLNINGFIVAQSGAGSSDKETDYFGPLTYRAVIKFQEVYASDILIPVGLTKGTGYFGPSTRAFVNK